MSACTKYIQRKSNKDNKYQYDTGRTTEVPDYSNCGLNASPGRDHRCPKKKYK
jgi:hypothetical protein